MFTVSLTRTFETWLDSLRDKATRARLQARLDRLKWDEHFGDVKSVGHGVLEMRADFGPGYRMYCLRDGSVVIVMLCGGDKSSQHRDIAAAIQMANELRASEP